MSAGAQFDPDAFMAARGATASPAAATFDPDTFMAGRSSAQAEGGVESHRITPGQHEPTWYQNHPILGSLVESFSGLLPTPGGMELPGSGGSVISDTVSRAFTHGLPEVGDTARAAIKLIPGPKGIVARKALAFYDFIQGLGPKQAAAEPYPNPSAPSGALGVNPDVAPAKPTGGVNAPLRPPLASQAAAAPTPSPTQSAPSAQPAAAAPTPSGIPIRPPWVPAPAAQAAPQPYMRPVALVDIGPINPAAAGGPLRPPLTAQASVETSAPTPPKVAETPKPKPEDEGEAIARFMRYGQGETPEVAKFLGYDQPEAAPAATEAPSAPKLKPAEAAEYQKMLKSLGFKTDPGTYPGAQPGMPLRSSFQKNARAQVAPTAIRIFPENQLPALAEAEGTTWQNVYQKLKEAGWSVRRAQ